MKNTPNQGRKAERLFQAFGNLDPNMIQTSEQFTPVRGKTAPKFSRVSAIILAAALSLVLVTFTVFAASPTLRDMINMAFLDENRQKETVPEGWIGIYTTADLDAIRNDLNGKYILMNDLTFTEEDGYFTPIGTQKTPFMGQFDGNGHVIRNLVIEMNQTSPPVIHAEKSNWNGTTPYSYHDTLTTQYVGLFGFCGYSQQETSDRIGNEINDFAFPYLADDQPYRGMICNLGVEHARINVNNASNVRVGVIAGQASYVVSCYVENCTVEATGYEALAESASFRLRMGGIAGNVQVMDSCYARNATLTVTGADDLYSDGTSGPDMNTADKATVFMGGLAGNAYTMVTSYAEGCKTSCDYAANRLLDLSDPMGIWPDHPAYMGDLYGHVQRLPSVMNYSSFTDLKVAMFRAVCGLEEDEPLPENWDVGGSLPEKIRYPYWVFRSYYINQPISILVKYFDVDPGRINPSLFTGDFTWETEAYVFDRGSGMEGIIRAERHALHYLGEDRLAELVAVDNLKVGPLHCYVLSPYQETYTEDDLDEFNFKTIWEMKDGRPVLRIFQ